MKSQKQSPRHGESRRTGYFSKPNTPRTAFSVRHWTYALVGLSIFLSTFRLVLPLCVPDLITIHTSLPSNPRTLPLIGIPKPALRTAIHTRLFIHPANPSSVLQPLCGRYTRRNPFVPLASTGPFVPCLSIPTRTSLSTRVKSLYLAMPTNGPACQFESLSSLFSSSSLVLSAKKSLRK